MPFKPQTDQPSIAAGTLRHRVEVQIQEGTTTDAHGQEVESWDTLAMAWASVIPLSSRDLWLAQQVQSDVSHRITIRYSATLEATLQSNPRCRVKWGDRIFHCEPGRNLFERNRFIEILAREEV